ncbi:MAG TPA: class I SAM-dependent methyltransferase [Desulfuromonadales bacterium]|nr:class I SAM-dependent methyltransferase [Desulfuromonadales bacterium]
MTTANPVQAHYENYPYPSYPLIASVRRCDTYALNLKALWARFNHVLPPVEAEKILIAGCGTFAPYPMAVANPDVPIIALDLSEKSLRRARWHCLLHGRRNVTFHCGDLDGQHGIAGHFGLIDCYGVLHHLEKPLAGLKALAGHLVPGGILRIMLYSRYARREEESIRRAFRLLGIRSPDRARQLLRKAAPGSRLADFMAVSDEAATVSGLADALLHPRVTTYRIDELLEMITQAGLEPLLFAHRGALEDPVEEIRRLRMLEKDQQSPGNFVLYLGKKGTLKAANGGDSVVVLNPCIVSPVSRISLGTVQINARIGCSNPVLNGRSKRFLRNFVTPVLRSSVTGEDAELVEVYKRLLFLVEYV